MPSIEQCDAASGTVAALPSTLEFFDKFKCISSISENGKDSDSEESFHLPLDDDDMENQSVVSNGRDKEIHNEETEDDILNKFETVPSGTPDPIDSHIEDSILDDENLIENDSKENEAKLSKVNIDENQESSVKIEKNIESLTEKDADQNKCEHEEINKTRVEIKLTYDFGEYENSGDGEFKSIYETDTTTEPIAEEPQDESTKPAETSEPMEIAEEPDSVECTGEVVKESQSPQKTLQNAEETLENFEDSMEVEQEDTNQDIANIIEKLEDPDTPMEDVEPLNDESDVNMIESCEDTAVSENIENNEKTMNSNKDFPEKDAQVTEENNEDVEMIGSSDRPEESCKENVEKLESNESSEVAATFQESLEASKDSTEACPGEDLEQNNVNIKECSNIEPENVKKVEDPKENVDEKELVSSEDINKSESPFEVDKTNDSVESNGLSENEKVADSQTEKTSTEILQEELSQSIAEPECKATPECDTSELSENNEAELANSSDQGLNKENCTKSQIVDLQNDDLLKELDETINESSTDVETKETTKINETIENTEAETPEEPEKDDKEPEVATSKDEEVFKTPVEVPKISEEVLAQREEKEGPDLQNEKSNDKTEDKTDDESDLLDISMVRETEEDDACAIADALDAQISEKSDEEQSEKVETEQEGSDIDKDNDNDPMEFDDTDDESHAETVEQDDSSSAESTKDKICNISESSKDSTSESEPKKRKKVKEPHIDSSNDGTGIEASASESGEEPEKMDVPDRLVPDVSLNLESTLVQDEAAAAEKDDTVLPATSEKETEYQHKESSKTDKGTEKAEETSVTEKELTDDSLPETLKSTDNVTERRKSPFNKRTLSTSDVEETETSAKKAKLVPAVAAEVEKKSTEKTPVSDKKTVEKDSAQTAATVNEKVKTLSGFSKFMQCRQFTAKLSRSDLEQFCIQKICESLMLKSSEGELHQTIKKHEKTIDFLRKDLQQLSKQCKDLEIVNKKLMNELRNQNTQKKPLVPLKITRSVGLQVRLNPGNETSNQTRRRQMNNSTTPQKQVTTSASPTVNRVKVTTGNAQQNTAVRQIVQNSPQKSPLTTGQTTTNTSTPTNPLLSQALQPQKPRQAQAVAAKRTATPVRKTAEASKPANPGVIDLTDEDGDKSSATKTIAGSTIKIINKTASPAGTANKAVVNKVVPGKAMANQGKQVGVQKTVTVGQNKGNTLSQGIRLTPASVMTSSANGSPQMVYVVPTITSNAGGTQKVAFVNFQPANGVISSLNGSTVSVMSNKGQTLTLKTVSSPMRNKHPAALPPPPRITPDPKLKPLLPKPHLTIKKIDTGIILQWKMPYNLEQYESIASYQLYAYQETSAPPSTDMWRKVGDVKALALPMACTLTQFADKNKYYFAVRSVDVHKRIGAFSDPEEISL